MVAEGDVSSSFHGLSSCPSALILRRERGRHHIPTVSVPGR
jgi:hypothetical protein